MGSHRIVERERALGELRMMNYSLGRGLYNENVQSQWERLKSSKNNATTSWRAMTHGSRPVRPLADSSNRGGRVLSSVKSIESVGAEKSRHHRGGSQPPSGYYHRPAPKLASDGTKFVRTNTSQNDMSHDYGLRTVDDRHENSTCSNKDGKIQKMSACRLLWPRDQPVPDFRLGHGSTYNDDLFAQPKTPSELDNLTSLTAIDHDFSSRTYRASRDPRRRFPAQFGDLSNCICQQCCSRICDPYVAKKRHPDPHYDVFDIYKHTKSRRRTLRMISTNPGSCLAHVSKQGHQDLLEDADPVSQPGREIRQSSDEITSRDVLVDNLPASVGAAMALESQVEVRTPTSDPNRFLAACRLPLWEVWFYRIAFVAIIATANVGLLITYFKSSRHLYLLGVLVFMKSKDLLSTLADIFGLTTLYAYHRIRKPKEATPTWIMSLVCAYAETEEQIMKTVSSLTVQDTRPHRQIVCIILDGKDADILSSFTVIMTKIKRPYITWKGSNADLLIYTGFVQQTPVILIRKLRNAGKKDSLILGHDLFNYPRDDMPSSTKKLRREFYTHVLPRLIKETSFDAFGYVFCTDADSTIQPSALYRLADAMDQSDNAIAACGVLLAEISIPNIEWVHWHLYQQFQYTFGQYVRRQAESLWGRVTCLPGCITMIQVRKEMGPAISQYAKPVTTHNLFEHQVQYLGTDRRLTWCILSQNVKLKSLFVPDALCETVVPETLEHYLSQRRRWASNAYFNDYYYAFGSQQKLITRLFAIIDIVRQSLVFYRVINTALFLRSLITNFYILKLTPTLVLTKTPALWFFLLVLAREPLLRLRLHKLFLGMCLNQFMSPILSVIVFSNVLINMGSQVWGTTGVSSQDSRPNSNTSNTEAGSTTSPCLQHVTSPPQKQLSAWTPERLARIVRSAIKTQTSAWQQVRVSKVNIQADAPVSSTSEQISSVPPSTPTPACRRSQGSHLSMAMIDPTGMPP